MKSIEEGFVEFNKLLIPKAERDEAGKHRSSVHQFLTVHFGVSRFFQVGSIGLDTDIHNHSYTDYFAVIPPKMMFRDSDMTLNAIRDALIDRFPRTQNIHIEPPAVVIPFGSHAKETTTIIPAEFLRKAGELYLYEIPDRKGGWTVAVPTAHNDYLKLANIKSHYRVKPLIRFLKAWKYFQNVPIHSFYLEIFVARYALASGEIVYAEDIERILKLLLHEGLPAIHDPLKLSGNIEPCYDQKQKDISLGKIEKSLKIIQEANLQMSRNKTNKAFTQWQKLLGANFPSYH
ncbi:MAG: nucleotidyltransferase [Candidatus Berkelbacteria bacterium]